MKGTAANWSQAYEEEPKIRNYRKHQHLRRSCGDADADDGFETSDVREYVKEAKVDMEAMAGLALVLTMGLSLIGWSVWQIRHE